MMVNSKYERNRNDFLKILKEICQFLGITIDEIVDHNAYHILVSGKYGDFRFIKVIDKDPLRNMNEPYEVFFAAKSFARDIARELAERYIEESDLHDISRNFLLTANEMRAILGMEPV